jgi:UTP--glucose-1-phosphate uridylyltransferase
MNNPSPVHYDSVDPRILQHMIDSNAEFLMEVTNKTKADVKVSVNALFCMYVLINMFREEH